MNANPSGVKRGRKPRCSSADNDETKMSIINAARKLFAKNGYDGTSVAEISKCADVNKALIFYYFDSKDGLLKAVLNCAAEEAVDRRTQLLNDSNCFSTQSLFNYYEKTLDVMLDKKEIIKILLFEALKENADDQLLFEFINKSIGSAPAFFEQLGFEIDDKQKLLTTTFFFDALTLFMYVIFNEKWAKYNGFSEQKVKQDFITTFNDVYINYIVNKFKK